MIKVNKNNPKPTLGAGVYEVFQVQNPIIIIVFDKNKLIQGLSLSAASLVQFIFVATTF